MSTKYVMVPVSLALHTKLKWRARHDGQSMSEVVRTLIRIYVDGDPRPRVSEPEPEPDFYDYLHELVTEAVGE